MFWMTKMLLINTGYGNADGKLGIAMDPNALLFVNMSCFHRADGCVMHSACSGQWEAVVRP
tara:strand:+ start:815 stop:997 length:183 start_codon:yes stop_codon:yes gene_type:complete